MSSATGVQRAKLANNLAAVGDGKPIPVSRRPYEGTYNVLDYGAKGDDIANDTAAVQACMADAAAAHGICLIPPGTYLVDRLTIPGGRFTIRGAGWGFKSIQDPAGSGFSVATLQSRSGDHVFEITGAAQDWSYLTIQDLSIVGAGQTGNAGHGIYVHDMYRSAGQEEAVRHLVVERVSVTLCGGNAIRIGNTVAERDTVYSSVFRDVHLSDCGDDLFSAQRLGPTCVLANVYQERPLGGKVGFRIYNGHALFISCNGQDNPDSTYGGWGSFGEGGDATVIFLTCNIESASGVGVYLVGGNSKFAFRQCTWQYSVDADPANPQGKAIYAVNLGFPVILEQCLFSNGGDVDANGNYAGWLHNQPVHATSALIVASGGTLLDYYWDTGDNRKYPTERMTPSRVSTNVNALRLQSTTGLNPGVSLYDDYLFTLYGSMLGYSADTSRFATLNVVPHAGDWVWSTHPTNQRPSDQSTLTRLMRLRGDTGDLELATGKAVYGTSVTWQQASNSPTQATGDVGAALSSAYAVNGFVAATTFFGNYYQLLGVAQQVSTIDYKVVSPSPASITVSGVTNNGADGSSRTLTLSYSTDNGQTFTTFDTVSFAGTPVPFSATLTPGSNGLRTPVVIRVKIDCGAAAVRADLVGLASLTLGTTGQPLALESGQQPAITVGGSGVGLNTSVNAVVDAPIVVNSTTLADGTDTTGVEVAKLTRPLNAGHYSPQVLSFWLGSYTSSRDAGKPHTRVTFKLKSADDSTYVANVAVMALDDTGCVTLFGPPALHGTVAAPANTTTPTAWTDVTVAGATYKVPLYQ